MHRVGAQHHGRAVEGKGYLRVVRANSIRVRRSSVHREIGRLDRCRIYSVSEVHYKVDWLRMDEAVASRITAGHTKTRRHEVDEDILLRGVLNKHPAIGPAADGHSSAGAVVV